MSDVLVAGGGHNGLVAAILAAQAGHRVTVLEQSDHLGGATVSETVFTGHHARLSRYSYLVSLFPAELVQRLGIALPLASRPVASYTPVRHGARASGLLVERVPGSATAESFAELTGSNRDFEAWQRWYGELGALAQLLAPALLGPLRRRSAIRDDVFKAVGAQLWDDVVESPIGVAIQRRFADDTVRGVVATDALIGTFASLFDDSLLANRCFLYHVIGRGTGEWLVPVGGMGELTAALARRAADLGVGVRCGTTVTAVTEAPTGVTVCATTPAGEQEFQGGWLMAAVAPAVLDGWLTNPVEVPVGSQLKINMLLTRLPRLASGVAAELAFGGTMHLEQGFGQLEAAYRRAAAGEFPDPLPAEVYCHSLTDPSILGGAAGATLTLFGLHTPDQLFDADPARASAIATAAALATLQRHLDEPLAGCLARDADGAPCIDVATPKDLARSLGMPGGHIFHGNLSWPWLDDDDQADGPADRYGVAVAGSRRILMAGAGSRRGGGVSGLGGAAAVDALLARPD